MPVTDFFAGEIAVELLKRLIIVSGKCLFYKSVAEQMKSTIDQLHPILREIMYSGVELPQPRQSQLSQLCTEMNNAMELCNKIMRSSKWSVYKNLQNARKLEKIDKKITKFIETTLQFHIVADVHHTRVQQGEMSIKVDQIDGSVKRLESCLTEMRIGSGGLVNEALREREEEELWQGNIGVPNLGVGLEMGKTKVREMLIGRESLGVVGICGIGGSGKTTLAKEICRDMEVKKHFNDRILFLTVSQSPDLDVLKKRIWGSLMGNEGFSPFGQTPGWNLNFPYITGGQKTLIVLDDVWSLSDLDQLISVTTAPGCKTLVVSRTRFETVFKATYEMELLRDHEAMTLFCLYAFGQKSVPPTFDQNLVKQIVDECKGLPLAIKVIGASLCDQTEMCWAAARKRLSRGEKINDSHGSRLLQRMKISTDRLDVKVRECFLDLGSFPEDRRIPIDIIINMWTEIHDIDEEEAFAILVELSNKNLLSLVKDPRAGGIYSSYYEVFVTQHDVLRDLAMYLNNQGEINARERLIMPKRETELPKEWERKSDRPFDARIVSIHTGEMQEMSWPRMDFPKAEVLILNCSSSDYFLPPFIENMPRLRALIIINQSTSNAVLRNFSVFSSLIDLRTLWLEKVVVPNLSASTIPLAKMRKVSLILCKVNNNLDPSVVDLPSIFPCLSDLTIDHCDDLIELPSSICSMQLLKSLSITNCHSLKKLPPNLEGLIKLEILRIYACPSLKTLPAGICKLKCLKYLDISQCVNLMRIPEGMGEMVSLEKIDMRECSQLRCLPKSALGLQSLRQVICDEEVSYVWRDVVRARPSVHLQVVEKCFTLDWLDE